MKEAEAMEFLEGMRRLEKDPDRSKILAIYVLLGFDDGKAYTAEEYQKAADFLTKSREELGDSKDRFIGNAIDLCIKRVKEAAA